MIARVSITDYWGNTILDTFVRPTNPITHFGAFPLDCQQYLVNAPTLHEVSGQVGAQIHDKIIVGYAVWIFLSTLGITHPTISTRDCAIFLPFLRSLRATQLPPLGVLVNRLLGRNIGLIEIEHPIESSRASLDLFRSSERRWEELIDQGQWPCSLPPPEFAAYFT